MKKTIIITAVLLLIAGGAVLIMLRGNEDNWICEDGQWARHGNPSSPMPTDPCGVQSETSQPSQIPAGENKENVPELIGGQKDERGCLIPAGYSWCEAKQKCLRTWEENCQ
jgi:hypothetical protein